MDKSEQKHIQIVNLIDRKIVTTIPKIEKPTSYNDQSSSRFSNITTLIIVTGLAIAWLYGGGFRELITKHQLVIPICVVGFILCAFGLLLWKLTERENNELKIISVNKQGVTLGRIGSTSIFSGAYRVNWTNIKCLDMLDTSGKRYLLVESNTNLVYKIKWINAFDWVSEGELLDAAKTYSPKTIVNLPRENQVLDKDDPRYTQLWLEYFSNPNTRKRKEPLKVGESLDNGVYKIEGRRAQGGQGTVYLASKNSNQVVIKEYILPISHGTSIEETEASSIEHEVTMLSSIDHPKIVKVLDCLIEDHRGYVVLEYVKGHSLRELVKMSGPVPEKNVIAWAIQIADILNYLHNLTPPIVHRDLTPDNLMLEENENIKLIDFTIAQHSKGSRLNTASGKHAYMPPEQIKGEVHPANDYYALGCTIYYLLTGVDPLPLEPKLPDSVSTNLKPGLAQLVTELTKLSLDERLTDSQLLKLKLQAIDNN